MSDRKPHQNTKTALYAILAAFLIPIAVIMLLSQYVGNLKNPQMHLMPIQRIKFERIAPIGSIRTEPVLADSSATEKDTNITKVALSGRSVR